MSQKDMFKRYWVRNLLHFIFGLNCTSSGESKVNINKI